MARCNLLKAESLHPTPTPGGAVGSCSRHVGNDSNRFSCHCSRSKCSSQTIVASRAMTLAGRRRWRFTEQAGTAELEMTILEMTSLLWLHLPQFFVARFGADGHGPFTGWRGCRAHHGQSKVSTSPPTPSGSDGSCSRHVLIPKPLEF